MKRQCDSTSSGSEHPASKLANVGGSTPNSTSNDDHLRYHLNSFGLLQTEPTGTLNSNDVNAATSAGTSTHSDNPSTHFDFGVDIDELLGDDCPLLSPKSPLFKSTTLPVPPSSSFDAQPTNLSMDSNRGNSVESGRYLIKRDQGSQVCSNVESGTYLLQSKSFDGHH